MSKRELYKKEAQYNIACTPIKKFKRDDIERLEREAQDRISYSEANIDGSRSHLNLFVSGLDNSGAVIISNKKYSVSLEDRISDRINGAGARIRKDILSQQPRGSYITQGMNSKESVVAIGIILQISHERMMEIMDEDGLLDESGRIKNVVEISRDSKTYRFFEDAYRFACDKWGSENIVGGYIHFDEYTPHMHIFVVPIVLKTRAYRGLVKTDDDGKPSLKVSLCAKDLLNRSTMKQLWKDFAEAMAPYGVSAAVGLAPKGTYDKAASMTAVSKRNEELIREQRAELAGLRNEIRQINNSKQTLEQEIHRLEMAKSQLKITFQEYEMPRDYVSKIEYRLPTAEEQLTYDNKVVAENAILHKKEIAINATRVVEKEHMISRLDEVMSRGLSKEQKKLLSELSDQLPKAFRAEKRLQGIPWFSHLSLSRIIEVAEPYKETSKGFFPIEGSIGLSLDMGFVDGSDSPDIYQYKVNISKLTKDETEGVLDKFRIVLPRLKKEIINQIKNQISRGDFSMKRFLHTDSHSKTKADSYSALQQLARAGQSFGLKMEKP